jgi:hypothetical protein
LIAFAVQLTLLLSLLTESNTSSSGITIDANG